MGSVNEVLDKAKEVCALPSDNQLAIKLKVTRATVSSWRHGRNAPDTVTCAKLAEITGIPLARVLGIVGEARAISREEKAVWRRLASAAAVLLMLMPALPSQAHTGGLNNSPVYALCEMARFLSAKLRRMRRSTNENCCCAIATTGN